MDYISAKEAAEKWGITVRWVQQCCKDGLIPGAGRLGNSWIIPANALKPNAGKECGLHPNQCMPLLNRVFTPGQCAASIEAISNPDERTIALGEYFYFSGRAEEAAETVKPYLDHPNLLFRLSASIIFAYANLTLQKLSDAKMGLRLVQTLVAELITDAQSPQIHAIGLSIRVMACVLLHLPVPEGVHLEEYLKYLPKGLRLYSCYVHAHQEYLHGDYWESIGIAELALCISEQVFVIPTIYLHLVAAMSLMRVKHTQKAKEHFMAAWELAHRDDLIEGFGEHHGLLYGLVETCLKKDYPADYERVIDITYRFSKGWRGIHNPTMQKEVAGNLTTSEFSIAMLACRGWSNQEIAEHLNLSTHTVKNYISIIYQKLHITSRKQLEKYMLK